MCGSSRRRCPLAMWAAAASRAVHMMRRHNSRGARRGASHAGGGRRGWLQRGNGTKHAAHTCMHAMRVACPPPFSFPNSFPDALRAGRHSGWTCASLSAVLSASQHCVQMAAPSGPPTCLRWGLQRGGCLRELRRGRRLRGPAAMLAQALCMQLAATHPAALPSLHDPLNLSCCGDGMLPSPPPHEVSFAGLTATDLPGERCSPAAPGAASHCDGAGGGWCE